MLDCETRVGKIFLSEQYRTEQMLRAKGIEVIGTRELSDTSDVYLAKTVDGRLIMCGVAEIKSRKNAANKPITLDYLKRNGYLVTEEKLIEGAKKAAAIRVPFYLIVRLIEINILIIWPISDSTGKITATYEARRTKTQATCNGGEANRVNAFLNLDSATIYHLT
jgi:hypothetical protein